jgi:hypothetical protein
MEKFSVRLKTQLATLIKDGPTTDEWYNTAFQRAVETIVDCIEQMELKDVREEVIQLTSIRQQLAVELFMKSNGESGRLIVNQVDDFIEALRENPPCNKKTD